MKIFKKIFVPFYIFLLVVFIITPTQVSYGAPQATLQPSQATQKIVKTSLCTNISSNTANEVISMVICTITGFLVPAIVTLAVVSFMWGVVQTLLNPTNEEARKKGKSFIMWGIIGLFVITSVWGIVKIFTTTFGLDTFIPPLSQ